MVEAGQKLNFRRKCNKYPHNKTHSIKVFQYLILCLFLIPKTFFSASSSTTSKPCFELTSSVLSTTSKQCFEQPAASFLVCSLIFIGYKQIRKSPVPHHEEQGFLSFSYSSVPRKFLATRAARTPPTIGARMKIQTC